MSAGAGAPPTVSHDLALVAPRFRAAVEAAIAACNAQGLDAFVYEAYRSNELQQVYYARGRTVFPPSRPVTNAPTNLFSWHGYGLAVDVISRAKMWDQPEAWFAQVSVHFKSQGCKWGGDWKQRDLPHFQWGACQPSPSDLARQIIGAQGMQAAWRAVQAD